jgi:hypothetical protein
VPFLGGIALTEIGLSPTWVWLSTEFAHERLEFGYPIAQPRRLVDVGIISGLGCAAVSVGPSVYYHQSAPRSRVIYLVDTETSLKSSITFSRMAFR